VLNAPISQISEAPIHFDLMSSRRFRTVLRPGDSISTYTVVDLLGQGGYGDIYLVKSSKSDELHAMKIESLVAQKRALESELIFLEQLQDSPLFPRLIESGRTSTHCFVVQELLGPSLSNTRRQLPGRRYTPATALRLALFMVQCIREFHGRGFVHQDVKPGNFLIRNGTENPLVLIDFGLANRFADPETGEPYPLSVDCGFHGTAKYASLGAHAGNDHTPRDDMISLLYSIVEMVDGRLPWTSDHDPRVIQKKKAAISNRSLFQGLPRELIDIKDYCDRLPSLGKVNYDLVTSLLCSALRKIGKPMTYRFDWEELPALALGEISAIPKLPRAMDCARALPMLAIAADEAEKEECTLCQVA
jgi:serine/threonine protein kinase